MATVFRWPRNAMESGIAATDLTRQIVQGIVSRMKNLLVLTGVASGQTLFAMARAIVSMVLTKSVVRLLDQVRSGFMSRNLVSRVFLFSRLQRSGVFLSGYECLRPKMRFCPRLSRRDGWNRLSASLSKCRICLLPDWTMFGLFPCLQRTKWLSGRLGWESKLRWRITNSFLVLNN